MTERENSNGSRQNRIAGQLGVAGAAASGAGAALVATAATACCAGPILAPIVVGVLGASGAAWAAGLKPYSSWLLGGSFVMLAAGFWTTYRRRASCDLGSGGSSRLSDRVVRAVLWLALLLWIGSVATNLFVAS